MVTVVPFTPAHAPGVPALILPIQQAEFGIAVTLADQPDLLDIPGFYQAGRGNFWVALDQGQVVGTIGLRDIGEGRAALRKMFVAASHRGREHGVAAALLETLLAWAHAQGLAEVLLGTTDRFLAAHRFYEKHGFEVVPREDLPASFPVMAVDSRFYRLTLGPASASTFDTLALPAAPTVTAPDGSDVRVLLRLAGGSMAHFSLAPGRVSQAVVHRTVEEIWYVLEGAAEMWRRQGPREAVTALRAGDCLTLPLGTAFQFRTVGDTPFCAVAITLPPWPGPDEAVAVPGRWPPA